MRFLGGFEHLVLLAVLQLDHREGAYAVPIRRLIEQRTKRRVSRGALYTVLERLESKAYLSSRMAGAAEARGGRAKRFYSVTPAGLSALRLSKDTLLEFWQGLDSVLGGTSP